MSNEANGKSLFSIFSPREISNKLTSRLSGEERRLAVENNKPIVEAWKQNRSLVREALYTTLITCADGFSVNVAVNQSKWGDVNLPIPAMVEVLHDLFHTFVRRSECKGLGYKF